MCRIIESIFMSFKLEFWTSYCVKVCRKGIKNKSLIMAFLVVYSTRGCGMFVQRVMHLWFTNLLPVSWRAQAGNLIHVSILLHCSRLIMPDELEIYCTTKFDEDILVDDMHCLNYIKRPSAWNEDVTLTIHIPCKQLKDFNDKKINILSGYSYVQILNAFIGKSTE